MSEEAKDGTGTETDPPESEPAKPRFYGDDRTYHPRPEEPRPLEGLVGRGQTEGTPMGLGPAISWALAALGAVVLLLVLAGLLLDALGW